MPCVTVLSSLACVTGCVDKDKISIYTSITTGSEAKLVPALSVTSTRRSGRARTRHLFAN